MTQCEFLFYIDRKTMMKKKNDEKKKTKKKGQTTKQFPFSPVDPRKRETERERTD